MSLSINQSQGINPKSNLSTPNDVIILRAMAPSYLSKENEEDSFEKQPNENQKLELKNLSANQTVGAIKKIPKPTKAQQEELLKWANRGWQAFEAWDLVDSRIIPLFNHDKDVIN